MGPVQKRTNKSLQVPRSLWCMLLSRSRRSHGPNKKAWLASSMFDAAFLRVQHKIHHHHHCLLYQNNAAGFQQHTQMLLGVKIPPPTRERNLETNFNYCCRITSAALRLTQASNRRRRRKPKPRTPKTSTYGKLVYTYFPLALYTLDAWRIDELCMKTPSALVSRSSLWSALALRKPNERELTFCEKSRA